VINGSEVGLYNYFQIIRLSLTITTTPIVPIVKVFVGVKILT